ncbi:MAG: hypothetical protein CVV50_05935 [Spirochaetae bacterium HGW-Spirochaetae-6]|nr:MAG: hypothetical protein CVV50_05935 [Spirochaetae bacterium HGW-Spirochaetae-6]
MKKKWLIMALIGVLSGGVSYFHRFFFSIDQVEVRGASYINNQLLGSLVDRSQSLFSLDKKELVNRLKKIDYIEDAHVSLRLMNTLVVEIEEKKLVADIFFNGEMYFLSAKGEIIRGKSYVSVKEIPRINLKKKEQTDYLISVARNLALMGFHDKIFFQKIKEISFDDSLEANIFILCDSNKYILKPDFTLEDLIKVRFIHSKSLGFKVFDLRGNYIVVNS